MSENLLGSVVFRLISLSITNCSFLNCKELDAKSG